MTGPLLVHGFADASLAADLQGVLGARSERLVVAHAGPSLVVFATPLGGLDPSRAFADAETVAALALDHAELLAAIARRFDVAPLRLGTLVGGREALGALGERQAPRMRSVLAAVAGRVEWGVRGFGLAADGAAAAERPADGRAYLKALSSRRAGEARARAAREAFCAAFAGALGEIAVVRLREAPAAGPARPLDLACLVARDEAERLLERVAGAADAARAARLRLEVTGPWPPFSFVDEPAQRSH